MFFEECVSERMPDELFHDDKLFRDICDRFIDETFILARDICHVYELSDVEGTPTAYNDTRRQLQKYMARIDHRLSEHLELFGEKHGVDARAVLNQMDMLLSEPVPTGAWKVDPKGAAAAMIAWHCISWKIPVSTQRKEAHELYAFCEILREVAPLYGSGTRQKEFAELVVNHHARLTYHPPREEWEEMLAEKGLKPIYPGEAVSFCEDPPPPRNSRERKK